MSRTTGAKDTKPRKRRSLRNPEWEDDLNLAGANKGIVKAYPSTPRWHHFIRPVVWFFLGFGFCYFFF